MGSTPKKKLCALIMMMFFGSLLEMLGIAMIMEACSFLTGTDVTGSRIIGRFLSQIGISSGPAARAGCLIALIILYLFKMVFLLLENHVLARFVCEIQHNVSSKLYTGILCRPYSWFSNASTAEVISLLNTDTVRTGGYLNAFLDLVSEALVLVVIGTALAFISPARTLCVLLGAGLSLLVTRSFIKPSAYRAGKERQIAHAQRLKWLKQGVQGIKAIKVWQAEQHFSACYEKEDGVVADCDSRQRALTRIPGLCIEAIMAVSILAYILGLTLLGQNIADALPNLAALAAAVIRLLPAVRRISGNLVRIANMRASAEKVVDALEYFRETEAGKVSQGNAQTDNNREHTDAQEDADLSGSITASHVTFSYESRPEPILTDINLEISSGSSVGITGPSGIGKTTLIDLLLGLLEPQEGSVRIGGADIRRCLSSYLRQTAYIPQNIFLLDDTIRNNVVFCAPAGSADDSAVWTALYKASLGDFVKKLPDGLDTLIGENGIRLSGGERQRLGIARALYKGSRLIVFDEATSALDPETEASVIHSIQNLRGERTMIIISHRASAVAGCDRIYRIEDGHIHTVCSVT